MKKKRMLFEYKNTNANILMKGGHRNVGQVTK